MRYELYHWPHIPGRGEFVRPFRDSKNRRLVNASIPALAWAKRRSSLQQL